MLQGNVIVGPAPWPGARCTVQMELAAPRLRCLQGERDGGGEAGLVLTGTGRALREGDRAGAMGDGDSDRERRGEAAPGSLRWPLSLMIPAPARRAFSFFLEWKE